MPEIDNEDFEDLIILPLTDIDYSNSRYIGDVYQLQIEKYQPVCPLYE